MFQNVLHVALGGAVGAALRYLTGVGMFRLLGPQDFPLAIITVNVLGSFLMGVFAAAAARHGLIHLAPLVMTGLLGGFTTFSAFSLDILLLAERSRFDLSALYMLGTLILSVGGLFAGLRLTRAVLT